MDFYCTTIPIFCTFVDFQNKLKRKERNRKTNTFKRKRASLVAQWLGVCLPVQGTRVRALVWEDPTCRGAIGPVSHNY